MTLPASGAISFSNINVELCRSSTAQLSLNDSCLRTLFGQASGAVCMNTGHGKTNTSVPGAPTGVSASATSSSAISVSFSAPGCTGHLAIDYYQVVCTSSGSNSATGSSSPISVSGLSASTSYTFKVRAHNSKGYGCYSGTASATTRAVTGSTTFATKGYYSWTVPSGVSKVTLLLVAPGSLNYSGSRSPAYNYCYCPPQYLGYCQYNPGTQANGGAIGYVNNRSVTAGHVYCLQIWNANGQTRIYDGSGDAFQAYGGGNPGGGYWYQAPGTGALISGTGWIGGGYGGSYSGYSTAGGGGAGYTGDAVTPCHVAYNTSYQSSYSQGGSNGGAGTSGRTGSGGGGGGGGNGSGGGGGGGIGLYGRTCSTGSGGSSGGGGGGGASGGCNGASASGINGGRGGNYGGGGGMGGTNSGTTIGTGGNPTNCSVPHIGAIRLVWPGCSRSFPSTCLGSP